MLQIRVKRLPHAEGLELPSYATEHSAGLDLRAAVDQPVTLRPLERALIPTGFVDYRGEVRILLINLGQEAVTIERGERIAQMIIAPVSRVMLVEVEELSATERGCGGFGSTGLR